jgi:5-methylcytosine-specific restriction endonuclease McrA
VRLISATSLLCLYTIGLGNTPKAIEEAALDTPQEKRCTKCFESKALTQFRNDKHSKDGKTSQCSDCLKQRDIDRYPEHRDEILLRHKNYRREHPDEVHARDKIYDDKRSEGKHAYNITYYAEHQEAELARSALYKEEHRGEGREKNAAYRLANPEKINTYRLAHLEEDRERSIAYRLKNLNKIREYVASWKKANPHLVRSYSKNRRAYKANAPINDLTSAQWLEIQASQDHRCYYCGKRRKGKLTQDHIIPLSKGGSHTLSNVIATCRSCNSSKHTGPPPIPVQLNLLTIAPPKPYKPRTKRGS